jgi:hypothetical protein
MQFHDVLISMIHDGISIKVYAYVSNESPLITLCYNLSR